MAKRRYIPEQEDGKLDISSLIDVSFLLLIYFLVTSTLQPKEGDLSMTLPSETPSDSNPLKLDPMMIKLDAQGVIKIQDVAVSADPSDREAAGLLEELQSYKVACEASDSEPIVIVAADDNALHQRFTDILDSLAKVEIKSITLTGFSD